MAGLWERLLTLWEGGALLGAGSPAGHHSTESAQGIVQGHAYAVLQVREVEGLRLLPG